METTVLTPKEPSMKGEWLLYELSSLVKVVDCRDAPGEGLLVVPGVDRHAVAMTLDAFDEKWERQLEILDANDTLIDRLLGDDQPTQVPRAA